MQKKLLLIAGISGALCVAIGAMGAHALENRLPAENLEWYQTGATYQFYHTLALLFIALIPEKNYLKLHTHSANLFVAGMILFSFSLYFLALRPVLGFNNEELKWLGAVTPFGGFSFILAWLLLAYSGIKQTK